MPITSVAVAQVLCGNVVSMYYRAFLGAARGLMFHSPIFVLSPAYVPKDRHNVRLHALDLRDITAIGDI